MPQDAAPDKDQHRSQVIWLHPAAPAKPAVGAACNGCGVCCSAEPCPVAGVLLWQWRGACRALRWSVQEQQYRCGLLQQPEAYVPLLKFLPETKLAKIRRLIAGKIAAGIACDSESVTQQMQE